jgi:hypothetical protein
LKGIVVSRKIAQEEPNMLQLREELLTDTIASRLKLVVLAETLEKRRFPSLEERTGISENTWRTWWNRGGTPGGGLVEGAGRAWPEYAFWLITGLTDVEYGHRMPTLHLSVIGYLSNWPEGSLNKDRMYATEYFRVCKELQDINKGGREKANTQHGEILENTRQFIMEKRREEICSGLVLNKWTGNEA